MSALELYEVLPREPLDPGSGGTIRNPEGPDSGFRFAGCAATLTDLESDGSGPEDRETRRTDPGDRETGRTDPEDREQANEQANEQASQQANEQANEQANDQASEQANEQASKQANEQTGTVFLRPSKICLRVTQEFG